MKFSVLLPVRNGLQFLKYAVDSVRLQNYEDWELIISDNASSDNIEDYINSLQDNRIKYSRSFEFLTVTENWNRALDQSSGEYVIMLGDDDLLLKNYFQIAHKLIENFHHPELIYTNAYLFAYPNVLPDHPKGLFETFISLMSMPKHEKPFWLDHTTRMAIVQKTLKFEVAFGTNMQHGLIQRSLIEKLKRKEKFFHSPYPDIYSMCALFIHAKQILVYPKEMVVIGITPKSHGYYFFNNKEKEAVAFLGIQKEIDAISSIQSILLPPSGSLLSFWLGAMEMLKIHFNLKKHKLKLYYKNYRKRQIHYGLHTFLYDNKKYGENFKRLMALVTLKERLINIYPQVAKHNFKIFIYLRCKAFIYSSIYFPFKNFYHHRILSNVKKILSNTKKILPKFIKKRVRKLLMFIQKPSSAQEKSLSPVKITNPIEKRFFSNGAEIFEEIEPVDLTNASFG